MTALAATYEIGAHPATALLIGGLAAAVLRGRFASIALVLSPLFGLFHVYGLELGGVSTLNLFGYEILGVSVDQQAKVFGYLSSYRRVSCWNLFISCQRSLAGLDGLILCSHRCGCCFCRGYAFTISLVGRIGDHFCFPNLGKKD